MVTSMAAGGGVSLSLSEAAKSVVTELEPLLRPEVSTSTLDTTDASSDSDGVARRRSLSCCSRDSR